jgi:hypothetical protein
MKFKAKLILKTLLIKISMTFAPLESKTDKVNNLAKLAEVEKSLPRNENALTIRSSLSYQFCNIPVFPSSKTSLSSSDTEAIKTPREQTESGSTEREDQLPECPDEEDPEILRKGNASLSLIENQFAEFSSNPAIQSEIVALKVKHGGQMLVGHIDYGFTFLDRQFITAPKVDVKWRKNHKGFLGKLQPTTAELKQIPSLYLKPGEYEVPGKKDIAKGPECGNEEKEVPAYSIVDEAMSQLVKAGEEEHCSDYELAFELSLKQCADNINALVDTEFGPGKKKDIIREIFNKIGGSPEEWYNRLNQLAHLSVVERDQMGFHTLEANGEPKKVAPDCSHITYTTVKALSTKVPGPASKDIIKY